MTNIIETFEAKNVQIRAARLTGLGPRDGAIFEWAAEHWGHMHLCLPVYKQGVAIDPNDGSLMVMTERGLQRGYPGDWVVQDVMGEFCIVKPHIFASKYRKIDD